MNNVSRMPNPVGNTLNCNTTLSLAMNSPYFNSVEELIQNESFLAWYFKTDEDEVKKWDLLISEAPSCSKIINEAVTFLKSAILPEKRIDPMQVRKSEEELFRRIKK
jgi:transmembrane sensor